MDRGLTSISRDSCFLITNTNTSSVPLTGSMEENSCAPSSSSSQPVDLSSRRSGQVHLLSWSDHFTRRDLVRKGSDDVNLQLPRKRQKVHRLVSPFPRILKRDMRRLLPLMLVNVVNSNDISLFHRLLSDLCVSRCRCVDNVEEVFFGAAIQHLRPFVIDGLANIVEAFGLKIVSIPDLIVRLVDSFTQHRLNTAGSKVFMQLSLSGTIGSQALVRCYKNQHCDASWLLPGFLVESLRLSGHTFHSQVAGDETLSSTYSMNNCSWWIVLHLDNNHRVYQMSIDGKVSIQPNVESV
eukprot:scaffold198_cov169-Ochromonas_danica.AAC.3